MYKLFINNTQVLLVLESSGYSLWKDGFHNIQHTLIYVDEDWDFIDFYYLAEKALNPSGYILLFADLNNMETLFFDRVRIIEAAGGRVIGSGGKLLMIYRRGYWDLPKGKIDKGETPEIAAIREIQEETGITQLSMGDKIRFSHPDQDYTLHTYIHKNKFVLKKTHWFDLVTSSTDRLKPQTSEGIEKVEWVDKKRINTILDQSYWSLEVLLTGYRDNN